MRSIHIGISITVERSHMAKSKTPILDKFNLHPRGGYCTCFSHPHSACEICQLSREYVRRWEALSPQDRKKALAESAEAYPTVDDHASGGR